MECIQVVLIVAVVFAALTVLFSVLVPADQVYVVKGTHEDADITLYYKFGLFQLCAVDNDGDKECGDIGDLSDGDPDDDMDWNQFRDNNLAAGVMIILGMLFEVALLILLALQLGKCMDPLSCIAKALNITFASLAVFFIVVGVIIMTAFYLPATSAISDELNEGDDVKDKSNAASCIIEAIDNINDEAKVATALLDYSIYANWTFAFGWLAMIYAITALILVCVAICCCA